MAHGVTKVSALRGGLAAWEQAGYPVETGEGSGTAATPAAEPRKPVPSDLSPETTAVLGDPAAPVTVIEFSDYQCPFCKRHFEQTLSSLLSEYVETGKVRYVFKDFPLLSIHPQAQKAAEAAECAGLQEAYWPMHDRLFAGQAEWSGKGNAVETFIGYAGELGLSVDAFRACLEGDEFAAEVQADLAEGLGAGVSGTPTFIINGRKIVGAQPYDTLRQAIEEALTGP